MIIVTSRPQKTLTDLTLSWLSKWWAVQNPIIYEFQRRDYSVATITQMGTRFRITLGVGDVLPTLFLATHTIYVNSGPYQGQYTVAYTAFIGAAYVIDIEGYLGDTVGGFVNDLYHRRNYYLEVTTYKFDQLTSTDKIFSVSRHSGNATGYIKADVSTDLQSAMSVVNLNKYTYVGFLDKTTYCYYFIGYKEVWKAPLGLLNDPITDMIGELPYRFYANNSIKQIQQKYGSNLGEYVTVNQDVATAFKAKFLCDFAIPSFFPGYPFDMAFIFSEMVSGTMPNRVEEKINIDGTTIGADTDEIIDPTAPDELDGYLSPGEIRVTLSGGYASNVKHVNLWIETGGPYVSGYVDDDYTDDDYVDVITAPVIDPPFILTEKRQININRDCTDNPIYLAWKNSLTPGGWSYWLFNGMKKYSFETTENGEFEQPIANIETAEGKTEYLNKKSQPFIQLGANGVPLANLSGMQGLFESVKVQMLVGTNPVKWQTVQVRPNTISYITKANKFDLDFIIDLPYRNTLSQ